MKNTLIFILLLFSSLAYSQQVTLECYYNDTLNNIDCNVCTKPGDVEMFSGVIVQKISGSDTTRTKIYQSYGAKIRPQDVLLFDNKGHTSFFNIDSTEYDYQGILDWFKSCPAFNSKITLFKISNDSIYIQLLGDSLHSLVLPAGFVDTDTDEQIIDTFYFHMDSIYIKIENDPRTWQVYLGDLIGMTGSDKQRFDRNELLDDILYQSLQRDSVVDIEINFQTLRDSIKEFYVRNDSVFIRIGYDTLHYLKLPTFDTDSQSLSNVGMDSIKISRGNTIYIYENQFFDTAGIVNNHIRLSIDGDGQVFKDLDLTPYLDNVNQSYAHTRGTNYYQNDLSLGGGQFTMTALSGLRLTGTTGNIILSAFDKDSTNESQTINAYNISGSMRVNMSAVYGVGGGMFYLVPGGIITIGGTTDNLTISATEVDGLITNEGLLGIGAGGASSSTILSNTSGQVPLTVNVAGILSISESTSSNGGSVTITGTEVDGNPTNEAQSFTNVGSSTLKQILSQVSGIGGGSTFWKTLSGITLSHALDTVTLSVLDRDSTNEIQIIDTAFIAGGNLYIGLTKDGQNAKIIPLPADVDNYVNSVSFVNGTRTLTLGRTGALSSLDVVIPDADNQSLSWTTQTSSIWSFNASGSPSGALSILAGTNVSFVNSGGSLLIDVASDGDGNPTNEAQTLSNSGTTTLTQTLSQVSGIGGGSTLWQTQAGISLNHSANVATLSVNDKDSTNEIQIIDTAFFLGSNLYIGLSKEPQNAKIIPLPADVDNYVDSVQFNTTTRNLKVGRTGALPDLTVNIPVVLDYDFVERGRTPPDNIYDTIFTFNPVGINDSTPDADLDILGTLHLSNKRGTIDTRFVMNWDTRDELSVHHTYHVDFIRSILENENDPSNSLVGFIDYTLYNAYPTYGSGLAEFVFGAGLFEPLKLRNDTVRMVRAVIEKELRDKNYSPGSDKKLLTSYQGTNILWDSLTAGPGIAISQLTITANDTSALNEIQNIRPYIVAGDTLGFILNKTEDTVSYYASIDTAGEGSGGSGTPQVFSHAGSAFLQSTLSDMGGSIKIAPGMQIEVIPTISGIDGVATIKTNFNGCQNCVGYFGSVAGYTNDSINTDAPFLYQYEEGFGTLNVPQLNLTQANQHTNPTALYIASDADERVYTSSIDATGFTASNFHHRIASATTINLPSGYTAPATHYFHNDGFAFTLARSASETIDGVTSVAFAATDKLVIVATDGSGKWYTTKVTASGGSSTDVNYQTTSLQFVEGTTMTTLTGSTSPSLTSGTYKAKIYMRVSASSSFGVKFALAGTFSTVEGKFDIPITASTYESRPPSTLSSGITSSGPRLLVGDYIFITTGGTVSLQGATQGVFDSLNVFSLFIQIEKLN